MNEDDNDLLVRTVERVNSLTGRVDKIEEKTEDIHKIATNIEVLATNMQYIKEGQATLNVKMDKISEKADQQENNFNIKLQNTKEDLQRQIDKLHDEPYDEFKDTKHAIKINVLGRWLSDLGIALVGVLGTLLATSVIKL